MRYTKRVSCIDVVGQGWYGQTMAMSYELGDYELRNIREHCGPLHDAGPYDREGVEQWLMLNSGDFQSVTDFRVTISDAEGNDFDSGWADEEGSFHTWSDCMYPAEAGDVESA